MSTERVMRHINADMAPSITTTFLMPPRDIAELSLVWLRVLLALKAGKSQ